MEVPTQLSRSVRAFRGGLGTAWLATLPGTIQACADEWSLALGQPFGGASLAWVAPARTRDGREAVLKIGFLADELASEARALDAFDGVGAVRRLACDLERGALLLERAVPGRSLARVRDESRAVEAAATVMRRLWRVVPHHPSLARLDAWVANLRGLRALYGGGTGPLPQRAVSLAERLMTALLATAEPGMLLHGDCHHGNVLRAAREPWLAIDPKGLIGDPAYEPAPFISNRWQRHPEPLFLLQQRCDRFADLAGLPARRVRAWAFGHAVLSAWWHVEDTGRCPPDALTYIALTEALAPFDL